MKIKMDICDNCKRPPKEFETDTGKKAYWILITEGDPTLLMSDFSKRFAVVIGKEKPKNGIFWCVRCLESINEDQSEN